MKKFFDEHYNTFLISTMISVSVVLIFSIGYLVGANLTLYTERQEITENTTEFETKVNTESITETTTLNTTTDNSIDGFTLYEYGILVNSDNTLSQDYTPSELVSVTSKIKLCKEVYLAWLDMIKDLNENGIDEKIRIISSYRTYDRQETLYNDEPTDGDLYSVMPAGMSEHQTGFSLDWSIAQESYLLTDDLKNSKTYEWLKDNAYKYGFIIRYDDDKTEYTKVEGEPWHLRYVGEDIAYLLYNNDLCLEEFYSRLDNNVAVVYKGDYLLKITKQGNELYYKNE